MKRTFPNTRYNVYSQEARRYYCQPHQMMDRDFAQRLIENCLPPRYTPGESTLSRIASAAPRMLRPDRFLPALGVVIMTELALIWMLLRPLQGIETLVQGILIQIAPVALFLWYWWNRRHLAEQRDCELLLAGRSELSYICRTIGRSMLEFRERQERYFEDTTIYDGYLFYLLEELQRVASERLRAVDHMLLEGSALAIRMGLDVLRKPVVVHLAVSPTEGADRLIPLTAVRPIARGLLAYMLRALRTSRVPGFNEAVARSQRKAG